MIYSRICFLKKSQEKAQSYTLKVLSMVGRNFSRVKTEDFWKKIGWSASTSNKKIIICSHKPPFINGNVWHLYKWVSWLAAFSKEYVFTLCEMWYSCTVVHNADICKSRFAVAANFAQRHKAWIQTQDTDTDTRYGHRHKAWTQTQDTDTDTKHEHRCKTRMPKFEIYKRVGQLVAVSHNRKRCKFLAGSYTYM